MFRIILLLCVGFLANCTSRGEPVFYTGPANGYKAAQFAADDSLQAKAVAKANQSFELPASVVGHQGVYGFAPDGKVCFGHNLAGHFVQLCVPEWQWEGDHDRQAVFTFHLHHFGDAGLPVYHGYLKNRGWYHRPPVRSKTCTWVTRKHHGRTETVRVCQTYSTS